MRTTRLNKNVTENLILILNLILFCNKNVTEKRLKRMLKKRLTRRSKNFLPSSTLAQVQWKGFLNIFNIIKLTVSIF